MLTQILSVSMVYMADNLYYIIEIITVSSTTTTPDMIWRTHRYDLGEFEGSIFEHMFRP